LHQNAQQNKRLSHRPQKHKLQKKKHNSQWFYNITQNLNTKKLAKNITKMIQARIKEEKCSKNYITMMQQ
jgi:hypothetical protein